MTNTVDTAPSFVSAKAADVILSDVRPTSITPDALRAVNILLDELLWLGLAHARSLEISRLKSGVLKAIPTQLGKDAILEAEIEIRAYRDKTQIRLRGARSADDANAAFPLQEAFDYLRYKCQVLSSFGDVDEDLFVEGRLLESYRNASSIPAAQDFAEAAPLYITAVIEHVSQHILSNIARVVARDSSRTSADLQNLFTSLCEDSLIYPVFKNMKVQSHIAQHLQSSPSSNLTRKKSVSSANQMAASSTSSTSSTSNGPRGPPPSSFSRSSDAGGNSAVNGSISGASNSYSSSSQQGQLSPVSIKSSRASNESRRAGAGGPHSRSLSLMSGSERAGSVDGAMSAYSSKLTVFDEVLESGDTVRVSLTPDRMKTFDVTKDKSGRATTSAAPSLPRSTPTTTQTDRLQPAPTTTTDVKQSTVPPDTLSSSAISYRGNTTPPATTPTSMMFPSSPGDTSRRTRFLDEEVPPVPPLPRAPTTPRRTTSTSDIQPQQSYIKRSPAAATSAPPVAFPATGGGSGNLFKKNRATQRARNRDSLDLDDIMDADDDRSDDEFARSNNNSPGLIVPRAALSASTSSSSVNRSVRQIKVSQTAQDLMDFLDSGPPEAPTTAGPPKPMDNSLSSSVSSKKGGAGGGRFMSMVSRLRRGSSTEKMLTRTRSFERLGSSNSRRPQPSNSNQTLSLPTGRGGGVPGQIPRHRSQYNLSTSAKAPPSSWTPPLPTPPKPPAPPQPTPLLPVPPPPPPPHQHQQTTSIGAGVCVDPPKRNAVPVAVVVEPSPLPSPVSIQFGRGGGGGNNRDGGGNEDEVVEPSLPASTLTRGSSLRSMRPLGTVPEQMGNNASTTSNGDGKSLSQSSTPRKPSLSVPEDLAEGSIHPSAPPSSSPSTPVRSPLRKASRDAAVAAASAAMAAGIGEAFQLKECTPNHLKTVRRPHTPTSPTVDARGRPIADDGARTAQQEDEREPEPVSAETAEDTLALHSRTSTSPVPSTTPSTLSDDLAERAAELRRMLAVAKHVEEARLLVDMFLIQMGLAISSSSSNDDDSSPILRRDETKTLRVVAVEPPHPFRPDSLVVVGTGGDADENERSVVEILLGDSCPTHRDVLAKETCSSETTTTFAAVEEVKPPSAPTDAVSV